MDAWLDRVVYLRRALLRIDIEISLDEIGDLSPYQLDELESWIARQLNRTDASDDEPD
jgi:hypothetical protein